MEMPFNPDWTHFHFQETAIFWMIWMIFLAGMSLLSFLLHQRFPLPILRLISHWIRWFTFACFFTWVFKFIFESQRPDWLYFITGLATWFILETCMYRISIQVLNLSEMNLFPQYAEDLANNLWPIDARSMQIKQLLTDAGFRSIGTVKARVHEQLTVRQNLFLNADKTIRLNVLFIPTPNKKIHLYFSLYSLSDSGTHYFTDNQNMPFAGYYPDQWTVQRYPLCYSLKRLLKEHHKRMNQTNQAWCVLDDENTVIANLNQSQRALELKNRQMGFLLYPKSDTGKQISPTGCFRIWMEMWLLAYFGKTVSNR